MYDPRPQHQTWNIKTPEQLMWTLNKYEENLKVSRKNARFLFNCLFDFGIKTIEKKIDMYVKLEPRPTESFIREEK